LRCEKVFVDREKTKGEYNEKEKNPFSVRWQFRGGDYS